MVNNFNDSNYLRHLNDRNVLVVCCHNLLICIILIRNWKINWSHHCRVLVVLHGRLKTLVIINRDWNRKDLGVICLRDIPLGLRKIASG